MKPRLIAILAAAGLLTLAATAAAFTAGAQSRPRAAQPDMMAGLGDRPGTPVGEPLNLHPDILILSAKGFLNDEECMGPTIGKGDEEICLTACNMGREPVILNPEALMPVFVEGPPGKGMQNTMFTGRQRIWLAPQNCGPGGLKEEEKEELKAQAKAGTLPAGVGTQILLKVMCLNQGRDVPDEGGIYDVTRRVGHPQLKEILELIGDKDLTEEGIDLVQDAIWDVTEYGGLTNEMRAKLRAL